MKNKYKIYLLIVFAYLNIASNIKANEFTFETTEIKITDKGNIIEATNGEANSIDGSIQITAEKFNYNKSESILNATKNATANHIPQNIRIEADNIEYNEKTLIFHATENVNLRILTKNILIESSSIYFDTKNKIIKSDTETIIKDNLGNSILTKTFLFNQNDNLIKINNSKLIDFEKNTYYLMNGYVNLSTNKFVGKDISIDFNNQYFDKDNEPRLKGNAISSDKNKTIINKGVFTTCKKNDDCPPWQISAKKITHDKNKKIIYYDDAWLKLYDQPVLYFPKFFHPDPTVKRQSGFLMPSLTDSTSLGSSFNVPYYHVISGNKDLTLRPRFYSQNNKFLLQSEYRQKNKNSDHLVDFSYMGEKNPTKNHFFSKSVAKLDFKNFEETEMKLQLQRVSTDTYLKTYKLESPIIDSTNSLTSSLNLETYREDLIINTNFQVFENLDGPSSDRYEYVYPNYTISKKIDPEFELDGQLTINSSGFVKNYNTNVFEQVIINDLLFDTNHKISDDGYKSNFEFLIKNVNTDSTKSKKYKEKRSHRVTSLLQYNLSYPLLKKTESYTNNFNPLMAIKFSPDKSKNIKDEDRRVDIGNIYSLNRIGVNDNVEEGLSLTYGFDFLKTNNSNKDVFEANIANILRIDESDRLPHQSGLGDKTSDIVGKVSYSPNNILKFDYDFSLDNNLTDVNYQLINTEFKVNNFVTSFEYLNENKTHNSNTYISNKTTYNIDDSQNFSFQARENKKTGLTEFYNLMYQYRNDCLIAAIEYNKDYYSDRELRPQENIFFKLTIIPFGETSTANLLK